MFFKKLIFCLLFAVLITSSDDTYYVSLNVTNTSDYEPSFAWIWLNKKNMYGGLWAVVNDCRTIDAEPSPWTSKDERIMNHTETQWTEGYLKYARCITVWGWGVRNVTFVIYPRVYYFKVLIEYAFYRKVTIVRWFEPYWEQCNAYSLNEKAIVMYEASEGVVKNSTYQGLKLYKDVEKELYPLGRWVWLNYTISKLPVGFVYKYSSVELNDTLLLRCEHGNDVVRNLAGSPVSFDTGDSIVIEMYVVLGLEFEEFIDVFNSIISSDETDHDSGGEDGGEPSEEDDGKNSLFLYFGVSILTIYLIALSSFIHLSRRRVEREIGEFVKKVPS
ncbi:MAG: hypothetical protein ACTSVF_03825 [Candidatus Asgardarchaeia archaeon]